MATKRSEEGLLDAAKKKAPYPSSWDLLLAGGEFGKGWVVWEKGRERSVEATKTARN